MEFPAKVLASYRRTFVEFSRSSLLPPAPAPPDVPSHRAVAGSLAPVVLGMGPWDPMRLFDDLMTGQPPPGSEVVWSAFQSPVNVAHTKDGATITVDMPGVDPSDLELTFEDATLTIAGKRGEQTYRYKLTLGDTIDPDAIEATLDKGVLTVHAHKRLEAKPRKILVATPDKSLSSNDSM